MTLTSLPFETLCTLQGAVRCESYPQFKFTSSYEATTDDKTMALGVCFGLVIGWYKHHQGTAPPFSYLTLLEELSEKGFSLSFSPEDTDISEEKREYFEQIDTLLRDQDSQTEHTDLWEVVNAIERQCGLHPKNRSRQSQKPISTDSIKNALMNSMNGLVVLVHEATQYKKTRSGTLEEVQGAHIVGMRCYMQDNELRYQYYEPNEGVAEWTSLPAFLTFVEGIIGGIHAMNQSRPTDMQLAAFSPTEALWTPETLAFFESKLDDEDFHPTLGLIFGEQDLSLYRDICNAYPEFAARLLTIDCVASILEEKYFRLISDHLLLTPRKDLKATWDVLSGGFTSMHDLFERVIANRFNSNTMIQLLSMDPDRSVPFLFESPAFREKIEALAELSVENEETLQQLKDAADHLNDRFPTTVAAFKRKLKPPVNIMSMLLTTLPPEEREKVYTTLLNGPLPSRPKPLTRDDATKEDVMEGSAARAEGDGDDRKRPGK